MTYSQFETAGELVLFFKTLLSGNTTKIGGREYTPDDISDGVYVDNQCMQRFYLSAYQGKFYCKGTDSEYTINFEPVVDDVWRATVEVLKGPDA